MPAKSPQLVGLGRAVRQLRHEQELTQEALAQLAGMHWTYIGGIERGERNATWETIVRIAGALDLPAWQLAQLAEELAPRRRRG